MVRPYTGFCVGLTKTCVGVSETWPPYTSSRIALTENYKKMVIFCQKIIQKLVFLGQFNAFLKKKLQKLSFLFNLMFVVVFFKRKRTKNGNFLSKMVILCQKLSINNTKNDK